MHASSLVLSCLFDSVVMQCSPVKSKSYLTGPEIAGTHPDYSILIVVLEIFEKVSGCGCGSCCAASGSGSSKLEALINCCGWSVSWAVLVEILPNVNLKT